MYNSRILSPAIGTVWKNSRSVASLLYLFYQSISCTSAIIWEIFHCITAFCKISLSLRKTEINKQKILHKWKTYLRRKWRSNLTFLNFKKNLSCDFRLNGNRNETRRKRKTMKILVKPLSKHGKKEISEIYLVSCPLADHASNGTIWSRKFSAKRCNRTVELLNTSIGGTKA